MSHGLGDPTVTVVEFGRSHIDVCIRVRGVIVFQFRLRICEGMLRSWREGSGVEGR